MLERTHRLVDTKIDNAEVSSPQTQNESYSLFNDWRQILFKIPNEESALLYKSAKNIDKLLHANLNELSKPSSGGPSPLLSEDLTTGIYAWGRTAIDNKASPMKAEDLFEKYNAISEKNQISSTSNMYSALVYCWSQASSNEQASARSLEWFGKIQNSKGMDVDAATWNALVRIHVRQRKFSGIDPDLLQRYSLLNDGYTFASLVEGWFDSGLPQKAYEELQRGIAFCLDQPDHSPALQQLLFLYFSKCIQCGRLADAERVMKQAMDIQENNMEVEILDKKHFVVVMNALAIKGKADQTNQLFHRLKELHEKGAQRLAPNYQILVILLSAITKKRDRESLKIAQNLLLMIEEFMLNEESSESVTTNHAYNVMLDFYVRSPHVSNKREQVHMLIEHMKQLSVKHKNSSLLPDKVSYASLMRAIIKEDKPGLFSEIDSILLEMENSDDARMQPDRKIYAIVLETLFSSDDDEALSRAKDLIERMESHTKLQPDRIIYTILIKIYSLVNDVRGSDQVLHTMIQAFKAGRNDCRPNEEAFVTAMSTWEQSRRSDSPDGALRIFNDMVALYADGNNDCRPSLKSFGKLMVILAKSEHEAKVERARRLFSEMEKYDVIPDRSILNWYIRVCATVPSKESSKQRESWAEALATFQTLRDNGMANSHTYNSIFHACDNLVENQDDQLELFRELFRKCRDDGQVNRRILTSLRRSLPLKIFSELTTLDPSDNSIQMKQIPASWKRNINRK